MTTILLNKQSMILDEYCDLITLLANTVSSELRPFCAVAVNRRFIARAHYSQIILRENDSVDIVCPMQGG